MNAAPPFPRSRGDCVVHSPGSMTPWPLRPANAGPTVERRRRRGTAMTAKLRRTLQANLTWAGVGILVLAILYILSYAPMIRWKGETRRFIPRGGDIPMVVFPDGKQFPLYRPIDWLVDHTPLGTPLSGGQTFGECDTNSSMQHSIARINCRSCSPHTSPCAAERSPAHSSASARLPFSNASRNQLRPGIGRRHGVL